MRVFLVLVTMMMHAAASQPASRVNDLCAHMTCVSFVCMCACACPRRCMGVCMCVYVCVCVCAVILCKNN
jgi:hypothetical protein